MGDSYHRIMAANSCRIDRIIWIPGAAGDPEAPSPDLADLFDDLPDDPQDQLYLNCPAVKPDSPYGSLDEWVFQLYGINGFLFNAATPILMKTQGRMHYSWGAYHTAWLYAAEEAEIAHKAATWATLMHTADTDKALG